MVWVSVTVSAKSSEQFRFRLKYRTETIIVVSVVHYLFCPVNISGLSPSMQYRTSLYHCIDDVICKVFYQKIGRFLDTDLRKQKFHLPYDESILLKRSKSNETSTSLQFDLCNQSKLNHTIDD